MLIMVGLGISDSNRGVFSAVFERDLGLSKPRLSLIVTVSYVGNLLFMLFGGRAVDRVKKKTACLGILGLWTLAQGLFFFTDSYACLLAGMFISMGASTLMNTMLNILSPYFFGAMAGLYVNQREPEADGYAGGQLRGLPRTVRDPWNRRPGLPGPAVLCGI